MSTYIVTVVFEVDADTEEDAEQAIDVLTLVDPEDGSWRSEELAEINILVRELTVTEE